jgi:hypothetical protein
MSFAAIIFPVTGPLHLIEYDGALDALEDTVGGELGAVASGDGWAAYNWEYAEPAGLPSNLRAAPFLSRMGDYRPSAHVLGDVVIIGLTDLEEAANIPGYLAAAARSI